MSAFVKTVLTGSLLGLIVLGCDSGTSSQASANPALGTWKGVVSDSTMTMVVKDSTFTTVLPNPYGTYQMSGTYTLKGNTITLNYASSLQGAEGIPPPSPNPVDGTLSGTSMTLPIPYDANGGSVTLKKQP